LRNLSLDSLQRIHLAVCGPKAARAIARSLDNQGFIPWVLSC
jgi:hypothetical protein